MNLQDKSCNSSNFNIQHNVIYSYCGIRNIHFIVGTNSYIWNYWEQSVDYTVSRLITVIPVLVLL